MVIATKITELLGITYPLIQGGMAWVADARLAAAVSNAGGLGIIAAANMPPELLDKELRLVRELTDKPFGLNIMLMSSTADDALELAASHGVPVVTTGAGFPGRVIERMKPLGSLVLPVIASVSHAKRVAKQGADAVIAEGSEAGGHIGETTTMCLVPQVAEAVSLPVIAAGGIADSRGVLAAFALGAQGVQVGTRFLCAEECRIHENYKAAVLKAGDRSTAVTGRPTGHPVRCLKNKLSGAFDELDKHKVPLEEYERLGEGKLRSAVLEGDADWGSLMAGQSAGMVRAIEPCAVIVESLFSGIPEKLENLKRML